MGFLGSLFGSDQRKDLKAGKKKSDAELQAGYEGGNDYYNQGFDLLSPYAQQGAQDQNTYRQAIGLGTQQEQTNAQDRFFQDPAQQRIMGDQSNALLRQQNARGGTYGGQALLAAGRLANEQYGGWLNRLQGLGGQGVQVAGQQSNIRLGQGDMRYGLGLTKAGQETNFANSMAANRNTGINNLLGIAGAGAKVYAASDIRLKRDVERIDTLPSGLPVYFFRYLWSDVPHIGVMAHEAKELFPDAIAYNEHGFASVDYSAIH